MPGITQLVTVHWSTTCPVSYTHLDVYKRQAFDKAGMKAYPTHWPKHQYNHPLYISYVVLNWLHLQGVSIDGDLWCSWVCLVTTCFFQEYVLSHILTTSTWLTYHCILESHCSSSLFDCSFLLPRQVSIMIQCQSVILPYWLQKWRTAKEDQISEVPWRSARPVP